MHTHTHTHTQSWESAPDRYRENLLQLIGKIGKDDVQGKTATKVREGTCPAVVLGEVMLQCYIQHHSRYMYMYVH